jgi:hypothetical protein
VPKGHVSALVVLGVAVALFAIVSGIHRD